MPRSILIVEDRPDVRRFLSELLECLGFIVYGADGFGTGCSEFRKVKPDLLLTDWNYGDGFLGAHLLDALAPDLASLGTAVVGSHAGHSPDFYDYMGAREIAILPKPASLAEIRSAIEQAFAHRPTWPNH